jgi:predicted  nucleic acid-binding Zn-ribbon protein
MIEQIMYCGIGFLAASLIGLVVIPLVHNRATRLTTRRLDAATPPSIVQIQAEKDKLRAEFALLARRQEVSVEMMRTKYVSQIADLEKKTEVIDQLKTAHGEKNSVIFALEARDKVLRDQLRAAEEEVAIKTSEMYKAERAHSDRAADLAKLMSEFEKCSKLVDSQQLEIIALKTQIEATKARDEILLYVMGKHAVQQATGYDSAYSSISVDVSREELESSSH